MRLARAQRLTGRATELGRAEARSAVRGRGVPGGSHVRPTRTTETGPRDDRPHTGATSLQTCLVFSAPRPRPSKSPGIHRKTWGRPRAIPECEHQRDWVAVGAVSSEPVSPRFRAIARRLSDPAAWSVVGDRVDPQSCWAIPGVLGRKEVACGMDPDYVRNLVSPLTQVASIYSVRRRGRLSTPTAGAGTGASSIRRGDR